MPRITRRHKKTSRKHVKKSKYTRRKRIGKKHRTRRRRGGMPPPSSGWMGPPVEPRDTQTTMANLLFKNDAYVPNSNDLKLVNLYDLQQAERELNAYFRGKLTDYNKRPVGITIENMKISNCTKLLRAGDPREICLNVEYERRMGSIRFTNFRQIGPLEIFKNDDTGKYEIPFITIINLLDLRFDAARPITEADARNPYHILSLLINDISEDQFERYPRNVLQRVPAPVGDTPNPVAPAPAAEPDAAERVGRFKVTKPYK